MEATQVLRLAEHKILRDAVSLFSDNQPGLTQRERRKQLAKIDSAKFDELDARFYDAPTSESDKKIQQYIERAHFRTHPSLDHLVQVVIERISLGNVRCVPMATGPRWWSLQGWRNLRGPRTATITYRQDRRFFASPSGKDGIFAGLPFSPIDPAVF